MNSRVSPAELALSFLHQEQLSSSQDCWKEQWVVALSNMDK